ncbi:MAG: transcription termination/antitermination protein NusG [Gemmiger sp.]
MAEQAQWYVVHTYSGYENKVAQDLMTMVENRRLQDLICDVKVPTETVMEDKLDKNDNKIGEKEVQRKIYPGYVFVKMVMNDNTWYIVRNTRGCTGFVGPASKPEPLSEDEVAKLGVEIIAEPTVDYAVGDTVEITSGAMEGSVGTVESIDTSARKVRVVISMFGREIPAELELSQVKLL